MHNAQIADRFDETADLLAHQDANVFRFEAYRRAAETIRHLAQPVEDMLQHTGEAGLRQHLGIGESLARSIRELVQTGKLGVLERLRGQADPVTLLSSVTGIGKMLAERLHDKLGIETLEQLEAAAHDGRLAEAGIGPKRLKGIIDFLAMRLSRIRRTLPSSSENLPSVAELLDVDREYREKGAAGVLQRIAPRRFNPLHETWLPILHTQRGARHYTALFSNTARAHEFGKTRDWVVLYYDDGSREQQCTIITSQRGTLSGHRIVRGRETECEEYYRTHNPVAVGAEV